MNDKDYMSIILFIENSMIKNYARALTEANNKDLHEDYLDMFKDISDL